MPKIMARVVIMMGRSLVRPAVMIASVRSIPRERRTLAKSTRRIAFLVTRPIEHDEADQGHDVDRVPGEQEHARHAQEGEGKGEHDREGIDEGFELGGQDKVDEEDGQDQGLGHVAEGFHHLLRPGRKRRPGIRAPSWIRAAAFSTSLMAVPRGRLSRLAEMTTCRVRSCRSISEGVGRIS